MRRRKGETNVRATWTDINIYRVADGQIAEEWFCGDYLGMMQQIGAIPSSARVD
jgi:hypothetical protein